MFEKTKINEKRPGFANFFKKKVYGTGRRPILQRFPYSDPFCQSRKNSFDLSSRVKARKLFGIPFDGCNSNLVALTNEKIIIICRFQVRVTRFATAWAWSSLVEGDEGLHFCASGKLLCLSNAKTIETLHKREAQICLTIGQTWVFFSSYLLRSPWPVANLIKAQRS